MSQPVVGALQVPCPTCRARVGRPCVVRRGYLYQGGAHVRRGQAWEAFEDAELAELRQRALTRT